MFRLIHTLPLPGLLVNRLQDLGFIYCEDICSHANGREPTLERIAEEVFRQCTETPMKYWKEITAAPTARNAFSILQEECELGAIETFCKSLDEYLDGGVPLQRITEISGAPGSGKTQLCLQLCVDVQIPHAFCGLEGQAVYVDTSNGFTLRRLSEIADACVEHCAERAQQGDHQDMLKAMDYFTKDTILQNVFYVQCMNYVDLVASLVYLKQFLELNKRVRLIVIDSITFILQTINCSLQRVQHLYELMTNLRVIAYDFKVAVVLTNNLTTRILSEKDNCLVPALGESFGHCVSYRFVLGHLSHIDFVCVSGKNLTKSSLTIPFKIKKSGIRDVE